MKIALVSPYDLSFPGGVTEHVLALAAGLQASGHEAQLIAPCSGVPPKNVAPVQPVTRRVARVAVGGAVARIGVSPLSFGPIYKLLKQQQYDVIHLQEPLVPGLNWWVLMLAHRLTNAVTVGTFHAYHRHPGRLYFWGRPCLSRFFRRLDNLIAVSEAARAFAGELFPGDYQIIPNGIDLRRFGGRPEAAAASPPTILYVGRHDQRKGFGVLFEAFLRLKPEFPGLRLRVVGPIAPGLRRRYQQAARERGVTGLLFEGYISPEALPAYYHHADIFCAPSLGFESFGIVLLEAMAAGVPVVASDIVGYRAVVASGRQGVLVPPGQPAELARSLGELLRNPQQRRAMGRQGQATATYYSWERITGKILDVYTDTINRTAKKQAVQRAGCAAGTPRRQPNHVERTGTQA